MRRVWPAEKQFLASLPFPSPHNPNSPSQDNPISTHIPPYLFHVLPLADGQTDRGTIVTLEWDYKDDDDDDDDDDDIKQLQQVQFPN